MTYQSFLESKVAVARETGFDIDPEEINPALMPHQRDTVVWALKGGRRAVFCKFGNTGVEFPESLAFARKYGKEHYGRRFIETELSRLDHDELRYKFAKELIKQL